MKYIKKFESVNSVIEVLDSRSASVYNANNGTDLSKRDFDKIVNILGINKNNGGLSYHKVMASFDKYGDNICRWHDTLKYQVDGYAMLINQLTDEYYLLYLFTNNYNLILKIDGLDNIDKLLSMEFDVESYGKRYGICVGDVIKEMNKMQST